MSPSVYPILLGGVLLLFVEGCVRVLRCVNFTAICAILLTVASSINIDTLQTTQTAALRTTIGYMQDTNIQNNNNNIYLKSNIQCI